MEDKANYSLSRLLNISILIPLSMCVCLCVQLYRQKMPLRMSHSFDTPKSIQLKHISSTLCGTEQSKMVICLCAYFNFSYVINFTWIEQRKIYCLCEDCFCIVLNQHSLIVFFI